MNLEPYEKELEKLNACIWDYAELKFQEVRSAGAMEELLEQYGFRVTRGLAHMPTAFVAEYGSGKPVIAILGEYDALSGLSQEDGVWEEKPREENPNGHGCGHCLLGTAAVGAGLLLKDYLAAHPGQGTIRVYGCPAEEGGSGKTYMTREGVFADVDAALTWHPGTQNEVMVGTNQANIQAAFTFRGRASHAAAAPPERPQCPGRGGTDGCGGQLPAGTYGRLRAGPLCHPGYRRGFTQRCTTQGGSVVSGPVPVQ